MGSRVQFRQLAAGGRSVDDPKPTPTSGKGSVLTV